MGPDIEVKRDGELMVAQVEGLTEEGVEFVDAYMAPGDYTVCDSGRIIVPEDALEHLRECAKVQALTVEEVKLR